MSLLRFLLEISPERQFPTDWGRGGESEHWLGTSEVRAGATAPWETWRDQEDIQFSSYYK